MSNIRPNSGDGKVCLEAQQRISAYLRLNSRIDDTAHELVASAAFERWYREKQNTPEQYASWELLSFLRKAARRQTDTNTETVEGVATNGATVEDLFTQEVPAPVERVRRFAEQDVPELKAAVKHECRKQFQVRLGIPWDENLAKNVLSSSEDWKDLEEAHEVHKQLRLAMLGAVEFLRRPRKTPLQPAPLGLTWWVTQFIEPLTRHAFMRERRPLSNEPASQRGVLEHKSARHRLVAAWDSYRYLDLSPTASGDRALNPREFALIWLLSDGWPIRITYPITAIGVIENEERTFRAAVREAGRTLKRGPAPEAEQEIDEGSDSPER